MSSQNEKCAKKVSDKESFTFSLGSKAIKKEEVKYSGMKLRRRQARKLSHDYLAHSQLAALDRQFQKKEEHICPICLTKFRNGQGLGGHMSRVHQGQSEIYLRKVAVREMRTFDRFIFRLAMYFMESKQTRKSQPDRAFIRRCKNKLYQFLVNEKGITEHTFVDSSLTSE